MQSVTWMSHLPCWLRLRRRCQRSLMNYKNGAAVFSTTAPFRSSSADACAASILILTFDERTFDHVIARLTDTGRDSETEFIQFRRRIFQHFRTAADHRAVSQRVHRRNAEVVAH